MKWSDFSNVPLQFFLALFLWFGIPTLFLFDLIWFHMMVWHIDLGIVIAFILATYFILKT